MKSGSLVEVVLVKCDKQAKPFVKRMPIKNEILTVRDVVRCRITGKMIAYFEEYEIGHNPLPPHKEFGYPLFNLVELQGPNEVNAQLIVEEILDEQWVKQTIRSVVRS